MLQQPLTLLECKISRAKLPQFLLFRHSGYIIKQRVRRSTGSVTARAPWFITFRCFCTRGSHRSPRGGEKAKAVVKASPPAPPHTGAGRRDGGIFQMTRRFRESPEKPKVWGLGPGTAGLTPLLHRLLRGARVAQPRGKEEFLLQAFHKCFICRREKGTRNKTQRG